MTLEDHIAAPLPEHEPPRLGLLDQVELPTPRATTGVHLARFEGMGHNGEPLIRLYGEDQPLAARSTVPLQSGDHGRQLAVVFIDGVSPLVIGVIQNPQHVAEVRLEGDNLVLQGNTSLELRCGKSALIMHDDGKVIVKGTHLVSRSSGANKIKGASISLN